MKKKICTQIILIILLQAILIAANIFFENNYTSKVIAASIIEESTENNKVKNESIAAKLKRVENKIKRLLNLKVMQTQAENTEKETIVDGITWKYMVENDKIVNLYPENKDELEDDVTIPNSIDGHTVIGIKEKAFNNCDDITTITIPATISSIGESAFSKCDNLAEIKIESENQDYVTENGVLYNKDKTILIQYPNAKEDKTFTLPSTVTKIGKFALNRCVNLEEIKVEEENQDYVAVDGILFNKDKTTLIQYPIGNEERETYTVLNTVTSIEEEAFAENTKITKLGIPIKVINIGENAFQDCGNLKIYCKTGSTAEKYAKENNINYGIVKTLKSIEITTKPTKTIYTTGEEFDSTGMEVTATYDDGSTQKVSNYTVTPTETLTTNDTKVTISYTEGSVTKTAELAITVREEEEEKEKTIVKIEISQLPTKLKYIKGKEDLDVSGGKIKITYSDDTEEEKDITKSMVSNFDNTKLGVERLIVTYQGKKTTYDIELVMQTSTKVGSNTDTEEDGDSDGDDDSFSQEDGDDNGENTEDGAEDGDDDTGEDDGDIEENDGFGSGTEERQLMSDGDLPYTGTGSKIMIFILTGMSIFSFVAYKKYKKIES